MHYIFVSKTPSMNVKVPDWYKPNNIPYLQTGPNTYVRTGLMQFITSGAEWVIGKFADSDDENLFKEKSKEMHNNLLKTDESYRKAFLFNQAMRMRYGYYGF